MFSTLLKLINLFKNYYYYNQTTTNSIITILLIIVTITNSISNTISIDIGEGYTPLSMLLVIVLVPTLQKKY